MRLSFLLLISSILLSCSDQPVQERQFTGLELSNMDTTVRPQDDFYRFANGGWLARTTIPEDRGNWNSISELSELTNAILLEVIEEATQNPNYVEGTDQRKVTEFFRVGMDSLLAEKVGVSMLAPVLAEIEAINNVKALQDYLVEEDLVAGSAFFSISVNVDKKNSEKNVVYLQSGGLGLPERDYYLKNDDQSKTTREKYLDHMASIFLLAGETKEQSIKEAFRAMAVETRLARETHAKEESRNPQLVYNKRSLEQLAAIVPSLNWNAYFERLELDVDSLIITEPDFMRECHRLFGGGNWNEIQSYLKWMLLKDAAPYLNYAFVKEDFNFNSQYLQGTDKLSPRWKRVLGEANNHLGEIIGQLYVNKVFPPLAKKKALEMVENIKLAMADRIKKLDWMSDSTKKMALHKLSRIRVKIGYPDEWKSYAGLLVETAPDKSSYYQNVINASRWEVRQEYKKLGKPVNKKEWHMTPQTVNAYYNAGFNEIVFPAAILQPPFYDYRADEAVNYGGIGVVIGHEISHGFDDRGSQFDADGNLNNWWNDEDLQKFKAKGARLARQFDNYEPLPGLFVQGQFTLGENIGDLGGINIAFEGLQRFIRENGRPGPIDGFSPEQRFFISWATVCRSKEKEEYQRMQINTNPHAPNRYRVMGPLSNSEPFYQAFSLKPGDQLYREEGDRIMIW